MISHIKENKWLYLIPLIAIVTRLIYLLELYQLDDFAIIMIDEKWHWLWAQEIVYDSFWGENSYFRGPLYPYFLSLLYLLTNGSILLSKILQIFLCGGTAYFLFKLTDYLFGQKTAIIAGFFYALYGTLIFYETIFLIPVIFLFLVIWGMYRIIKYSSNHSLINWLITGIIFGLAALARPNILLVIPLLLLWLFLKHRKENYKPAIKSPLALLFGLIICITPITIRNYIVTGDFILISSQGGINLYLGNNSMADGLTMIMPEIILDESIGWSQFTEVIRQTAEKETGHKLSDAQLSSF